MRFSADDERDGEHLPVEPQLRPSVARRMKRPSDLAETLIENLGDDELVPLWLLKITQAALRQTLDYLVSRPPEAAGILLGPHNDDSLVTHFVPDLTGAGNSASFHLDTDELNRVLRRMKPAGLNCKGIAHSHPAGVATPSLGDVRYLQRIFSLPQNAAAGSFYMPIVCGGRLYPYVYAAGQVWHAELVVI